MNPRQRSLHTNGWFYSRYERLRWWWHRVTGRDCTAWMQSQLNRAEETGNNIVVPRGEYHIGSRVDFPK